MLRRARKSLRRAAKWIEHSDPLILMYHRVSDTGPDPWGLSVSPRHFAEHLQVLRRCARPLALRELQPERGGSIGPQTVILTFDDGYADNLLAALPLLRDHSTPATVFVTTALLGKARAFWWDELADLLLRPGRLPETLEVTVRGSDYRWALGASVEYGEIDYISHYRWAALMQPPPTERHSMYLSLWELLLPLAGDERTQILDSLAAWSGNQPAQSPTHRALTEEELTLLGSDKLVEIGAHSVTHSVLPTLPVEAQRREVMDSKRVLDSLVEKPITSFSYPYGRASESTGSVVRDAGFQRACSTRPGRVQQNGNPFDLPRIAVRDCDGEQFERLLDSILQ